MGGFAVICLGVDELRFEERIQARVTPATRSVNLDIAAPITPGLNLVKNLTHFSRPGTLGHDLISFNLPPGVQSDHHFGELRLIL